MKRGGRLIVPPSWAGLPERINRLSARWMLRDFYLLAYDDYRNLKRMGLIVEGKVNRGFMWPWHIDKGGKVRSRMIRGCTSFDDVQAVIDFWTSDWPERLAKMGGFEIEGTGKGFDDIRRRLYESEE